MIKKETNKIRLLTTYPTKYGGLSYGQHSIYVGDHFELAILVVTDDVALFDVV